MENHRRPPHFHGLPSQAPRVRPEPPEAPKTGSSQAPAEPRRQLKRPHERYAPQLPFEEVLPSEEAPVRRIKIEPAAPTQPARGLPRAAELPDRHLLSRREPNPDRQAGTNRMAGHSHVRVPAGAAVRATLPHYQSRLPADLGSGDPLGERNEPTRAAPGKRTRRKPKVSLWKRARRAAKYGVLLMAAGVVAVALTAPQFNVKGVDTPRDLRVTPSADVAKVASMLAGKNWLRAPIVAATRQLEALPMVEHASVVREMRWPPRIALQIDERQAFARVGGGDNWWIVDRNGIPFRPAAASDFALNAITFRGLVPVAGHPLPNDAWAPVLQFTKALDRDNTHGEAWQVERIYFDNFGNASLRLADAAHHKMLLRLGNDRWNDKLTRARSALSYFAETGRDPEVLDLRSYARPLWKPRGTVAVDAPSGDTNSYENPVQTPPADPRTGPAADLSKQST